MASLALLEESSFETECSDQRADRVTAIIPTCNRPALVRRAILSALGQSYRRLDVVLVIDGCNEETRRLASQLQNPRLTVVELGENAGAARARNIGVSVARGEWVAFLDDDDEWLPHKIETQMQCALVSVAAHPVISSRVVVRTPTFDWISPARVYIPNEPLSEYLFCRDRFVDGANYMQTSTLLMQRELMLKIPFQSHLKRHQDWDWLLRAATEAGVEFCMLPDALAVFNVEDGRTSIGRSLDWASSQSWARDMRHAFTPRAYSFFIANECVSRAAKAHAGGGTRARLAWEFFAQGQPTPRSLLSLAGFLCVPESIRNRVRQTVRRRRSVMTDAGVLSRTE